MAEFPKLADLPDDMTVGELKRMTDMLTRRQTDATGFMPTGRETYMKAREPSVRESLTDAIAPYMGPVAGASPLANSERDAYRSAEAVTDFLPIDPLQGISDTFSGEGGTVRGLARMTGEGFEGNPLFGPTPIAMPDEPGFMEAQAGPKAERAKAEGRAVGEGKAAAIRLDAESRNRIAEESAAFERAEKKRLADEEFEKREAHREATTPFRQKHPWASAALNIAGPVASLAVPYAARKKINKGIEAAEGRLDTLSKKFDTAKAADDFEGAAVARGAMREEHDLFDKATSPSKTAAQYGAAGAAGAGLSAEGQLFPEQYDYFNFPDGPERERAFEKGFGPEAYQTMAGRGLIGGLGGLGAHWKAGPAKRPDNWAETKSKARYGSEDFDGDVADIAMASRNTAMQKAATDSTRQASRVMSKPVKGGELKAAKADPVAIPSKTAAKRLPPPDKSTKATPEVQAAYAKAKATKKELVAKKEKAVSRDEIVRLETMIKEQDSYIRDMEGTVMKQLKDLEAFRRSAGG